MEGTASRADPGSRAGERHRAARQALIAYLDTSAFFKLIVPEPGSAEAAASWLSADRRVSSVVLYAETRAALVRARRMGRFPGRTLARARERVEALWGAVDRLDVSEALARLAGDLAESQGLRAYDAVHLASAVSVADAELVLVAADGDLLTAARSLGIATTSPA